MRKIGAYVLGVFLLLLLGAALIHPSLLVVADWLSPTFGSGVYGVVTMAFLMLGDPVDYPSVLFVWVFVALVVGVVVRRRLGALLVSLLVWLTMLPITASVVFSFAEKAPGVLGNAEGLLGGLPPLPSGMTITSIFEAPIAGEIIKGALAAFSGDVSGQMFLEQTIGGLLTDFALKPVILVVGTLIGVELGRLAQRRGFGFLSIHPRSSAAKVGAMLLIILASSAVLLPYASAVQFGDEAYIESMIGAMDRNGRSYIGDVFMDTSSTLSELGISQSDAGGLAAAIVVSQTGVIDVLQRRLASNADMRKTSSLMNLLPPTFAVIVYLDVPKDAAAQRSQLVSHMLSDAYGVDLSQLTSFNIKSEDWGEEANMPLVTISFYQSDSDMGVFADNYLNVVESHGGFVDAIKGAVSNSRLIPGETSNSATGALFAAGFVNVDVISQYIPAEEIPTNMKKTLGAFLKGSVSFAGGVSFWDHGKQPAGGSADLDILNLLGDSVTPSYSPNSDLSFLVTLAPPSGGKETPNVNISTNVSLSQNEIDAVYSFLNDMGWIGEVKQGTPKSGDLQIDANGVTLPLDVDVTKTITGSETSTVTITVANSDTEPMTDVIIDDSGSLSGYTTGIELVSGTPIGTWEVIPPGETRTITYSVRIDNPGVYTLQPANLSYTGGGVEFSDVSNRVEAVVSRPLFIFTPFELVALTWVTGSQILDMATGRGTIIMAAITLALVALVMWDGLKSYRHWTRRSAGEAPQPEPEGKSEAPP